MRNYCPKHKFVDRIIREVNLNNTNNIFQEDKYIRDQNRPPVVKKEVDLGAVKYYKIEELKTHITYPTEVSEVSKPKVEGNNNKKILYTRKRTKPIGGAVREINANSTGQSFNKVGIKQSMPEKIIYKDKNGNDFTIYKK